MKVNDYLEKLKAAKAAELAKSVRLPLPSSSEPDQRPKGLPCRVCGQPSRAILNGACIPCDTAEVAARLKAKHAADKARACAERDILAAAMAGDPVADKALGELSRVSFPPPSDGLRLVWSYGREV